MALLVATGMATGADNDRLRTNVRYDQEYPVIGYSGPATQNRVWRVQQQLNSGELKLAFEPKFGYLRSLLKALDIDADSQVLVYSRTSLQIEHIDAHAPRAVYFNDDTYVGYVQDTPLIELTVIDNEKGAVFYAFDNREDGTVTHMEARGRTLPVLPRYLLDDGRRRAARDGDVGAGGYRSRHAHLQLRR